MPPEARVPRQGREVRFRAYAVADDLPASFRYALHGVLYAWASQRNFRLQVAFGSAALTAGFWLQLEAVKLCILVLTVTAVLVLELLNTAVEAVVDLAVGRQFHVLARIAKDCAAAGVLVAAFASVLIALLVLLPELFLRLQGGA